MSTSEKNLPATLKRLRGIMSQAEIARLCGISQQSYNRYEAGTVTPKHAALHRIATHYGLTVDQMLAGGEGPRSKRELFLKRLENQNVKAIREDLKGDRSGNIQPDEETVALMRIARTDGHVSVTGRDENQRRKTVSTKQHPMLHHGRVDCEADEIDEFERIAYAFNEICQRQIEDNL